MLFFLVFLIFEESLLVKDPIFSKEDAYVLDRKHSYERSLQQGLRMIELIKEHQITDPEEVVILKRCWWECTFVSMVSLWGWGRTLMFLVGVKWLPYPRLAIFNARPDLNVAFYMRQIKY